MPFTGSFAIHPSLPERTLVKIMSERNEREKNLYLRKSHKTIIVSIR